MKEYRAKLLQIIGLAAIVLSFGLVGFLAGVRSATVNTRPGAELRLDNPASATEERGLRELRDYIGDSSDLVGSQVNANRILLERVEQLELTSRGDNTRPGEREESQ